MALYDWPDDIRPSTMTMGLTANTRSFRSTFSGAVQTSETPGTRWTITMTFNNKNEEESRKIESLLVKLNGMSHRVKCRDFGRDGFDPAGVPLIDGADQTGNQLSTKGWNPSTLVLLEGDYFVVNGELKMVTGNVTSEADGTALVTFGPPLRRSPANNAAIDTKELWVSFLQSDTQSGVDREPAFNNSISINLEEDIT